MNLSCKLVLLAACGATFVACGGATDESVDVSTNALAPPVGDLDCGDADPLVTCHRDPQGRSLQGAASDRLAGVSIPRLGARWRDGTPAKVVLDDAGLKVVQAGRPALRGAALVGLSFAVGAGGTLRVLDYAGPDARGTGRYVLEHDLDGGWSAVCPGHDHAYLLPGAFTSSGLFQASATHYTFACRRSAAAKAFRWGYNLFGRTVDPVLGFAPVEAFAAATRLARADYCGAGRAHTINRTPIFFADPRTVSPEALAEAEARGYRFEAAWSGARGQGALCLAKWRYQSLAADECGMGVDPRNGGDALFCEDLAMPGMSLMELLPLLADAGTPLVSFSRVSDEVGLWSWSATSDGREHVVVTDLGHLLDHDRLDEVGNTFPPYFAPGEYRGARYLASLVKQPREEMIPLRLLRRVDAPQVYFTTTKDDFSPDEWEVAAEVGYIYPLTHPMHTARAGDRQRVLLRSYSQVVDGVTQFRLFTADEAPVDDPAFKHVRDEGYALR
jgi:hypothetical protein